MTASTMPPWLQAAAIKASGMQLAATNTKMWWQLLCDEAIAQLAATGDTFDATSVAELGVPDPDHPSRWGPRFAAAAKAGLIEPVGYGPSRRPTTAKSAVRHWRGTALASPKVPEVGAVLEAGGRTVRVERCPFCRRPHTHGAPDGDGYGSRLSHCASPIGSRTYVLVPARPRAVSA